MSKKIQISFKDNQKEIELYNYAMDHYSVSAYIKDLIRKDKEKNNVKENDNNIIFF